MPPIPSRCSLLGRAATASVAALSLLTPALDPAPGAAATSSHRYRFANVTTSSGLQGEPSRTWGSAWSDYDGDGDADLFVGRHWYPPQFFVNQGNGTYTELQEADFQEGRVDRHSCVWGEANLDGRPDLFCTRGAGKGEGEGANQLFIGRADGTFDELAEVYGLSDRYGRGRSANWLDFDSDGDLDLFVANHRREGTSNVMFRNDNGVAFRRVGIGLARSLASVSSSWSDWDRDGDPDLLVFRYKPRGAIAYRNVEGRFRAIDLARVSGRHWLSGVWGDYDGDGWPDLHLVNSARSLVLRNARGRFVVAHKLKLRNGRMSAWLDVDNDADLDLFVVQGAESRIASTDSVNRPDFLLVNRKRGFSKVTDSSFRGPKVGNGDSVAAADHDRDGRVDVFVTNGYWRHKSKHILLENRSTLRNWTAVDLVGHPRNPFGIGVRIIVTAGDHTYRRQLNDGFAFRAQSELGFVHLGLGRAGRARVRVAWPRGPADCLIAKAGTIVRVAQGTRPC